MLLPQYKKAMAYLVEFNVCNEDSPDWTMYNGKFQGQAQNKMQYVTTWTRWFATLLVQWHTLVSMPYVVSMQSGEEPCRLQRTSTHRAAKDSVGKWKH